MNELQKCSVCKQKTRRLRQGRCDPCYRYWRRTGKDRTPAQIESAFRRAYNGVVRRQELAAIFRGLGA